MIQRRSTTKRVTRTHYQPDTRSLSVDQMLLAELRGVAGDGGAAINPRNAMTFAAVFSAINRISTDFAVLPAQVYQRMPNGSRRQAREHPLYSLLHDAPNRSLTSFEFRQTQMSHVLGWGNGRAEIIFTAGGVVAEIHLCEAGSTRHAYDRMGNLWFEQKAGPTLPARRVFNAHGLSPDGVEGWSPIKQHAQGISLGKMAETFGYSFYAKGARPSGVIELGRKLNEQGVSNLRNAVEGMYSGAGNAGRVLILEEGHKYTPVSISPENAQYVATRAFQVIEVARMFSIPPHKIGDYSQAHLANLEESNLDYLTTTQLGWIVMWEQEANRKLLTPQERLDGYYVELNMSAFLRGNSVARADVHTKMFRLGKSINEIRQDENEDPIPDEMGGNKHFVPLDCITLERAGDPTEPAPKAQA